jgi:hypothetical protein
MTEQCAREDVALGIAAPAAGCFGSSSAESSDSWSGTSTGATYTYTDADAAHSSGDVGAYQYYIRLEPELVDKNIGLLELLRKDRWVDQSTQDIQLGGLAFNADLQHLTHFELRWKISVSFSYRDPFESVGFRAARLLNYRAVGAGRRSLRAAGAHRPVDVAPARALGDADMGSERPVGFLLRQPTLLYRVHRAGPAPEIQASTQSVGRRWRRPK